jgi:hypothetical protein
MDSDTRTFAVGDRVGFKNLAESGCFGKITALDNQSAEVTWLCHPESSLRVWSYPTYGLEHVD